MRKAVLICRSTSRHGTAYLRRLLEELPKRGIAISETHVVRRRRKLQKRVRQAVKAGRDLIVVVGGDGTQTAAVAELAGTDSVLAVVPAGTGNSFALSLGIKGDLETALDVIAGGRELRVDLGIVNGKFFANVAVIGLAAAAAKRAKTPVKRIIGPIAYGIAAVVPTFRRKPFKLRVKSPDRSIKIVTHQAIVAGGRYFGWQPVTPDADVRSGELSFFAASEKSPVQSLATNAALLLGKQTKLDGAHSLSAPKIRIRTKPKQPLNIDGHALGTTPATFRVAPKALRVLVPAGFEGKA